jgi:hypothetical protein
MVGLGAAGPAAGSAGSVQAIAARRSVRVQPERLFRVLMRCSCVGGYSPGGSEVVASAAPNIF